MGNAAANVLYRSGETVVLCTASVEEKVPPWMEGKGKGWVTAEYNMLPGSTPTRKRRDRDGKVDGRTTEIQRLIGRSLRAVVNLFALGERTVTVDCDVLQADGGTRTAAITGGFIALAEAIRTLAPPEAYASGSPGASAHGSLGASAHGSPGASAHGSPGASAHGSWGEIGHGPLVDSVAAISVGVVDGSVRLDLDYALDVAADVDMNIVMTGSGRFVEIQGTGEEATFDDQQLSEMLALGRKGIAELTALQRKALGR